MPHDSVIVFFFSSRRRHTRLVSDWSSDVCSSDLHVGLANLEVDNAFSLTFQGPGTHQHFEGSFGSQPRHPVGKAQLCLSGSHTQTNDYTPQDWQRRRGNFSPRTRSRHQSSPSSPALPKLSNTSLWTNARRLPSPCE